MNKKTELQKLYYNCIAKKDAHYKSSIYCQHMDKIISVPQIILSSMLSTSTFSQATSNLELQTDTNLNWFIASSSISLTILTALSRFFDFSSRKENNKRTSLNYGNLERHIRLHISDNEEENKELFKYASDEYSKIRENAPLISTWKKCDNYENSLERIIRYENELEQIIIEKNKSLQISTSTINNTRL